jgi:hypothetical protein
MLSRSSRRPILLLFVILVVASFGLAQSSAPATPDSQVPNLTSPGTPSSGDQSAGSISGTVVDQSGAVVSGARVVLSRAENPPNASDAASAGQTGTRLVLTDGDGQFSFPNVAPGAFHLTISSAGLKSLDFSGTLAAGQIFTTPQIALAMATAITEVEVGLTRPEVAEEQIKIEEQQRILGIVPNFYVTYIPDAAPLTSKQKFKLAARTMIDPVTFVIVGASAGVEQAQNHFIEYGQGADGYAKRFGANYADAVSGTFIGGAILPSLFKQDPRYFYKGTGSKESRLVYAIEASVRCKGDNGRWQLNYSSIIGSLASGGLSNLYYPDDDRNSAGLTFTNAAIGIVSNAVTNVLQEFVIKKFTPKTPGRKSATP